MAHEKRNYGLDIYKILSMLLVISFHFSDHGVTPLLSENSLNFNWILLASSRIWGGVCNCCFMLVSGYFLSSRNNFTWNNVLKLYGQVWLYSIGSYVAAVLLGTIPFGKIDLIKALLPLTFNRYWYFSTYIVIYLFHPFINRMIDAITQKQHQGFCALSIILFSVYYTFTHAGWIIGTNRLLIFVSLYFIGAYIRKYDVRMSKRRSRAICVILLFASVVSLICMKFVAFYIHMDNAITYFVWGIEKIMPVATSVFLFLTFEQIEIKNILIKRCIIFISPSLFGVYLFHIGDLKIWLFQSIFNNENTYQSGLLFLTQMLIAMISIFTVGILIDKLRITLFERPFIKVIRTTVEKMDNKTRQYFI